MISELQCDMNMTSKFMRKGELTRAAILDVALDAASRDGLEGLTIGLLAEKMNMSKSGVFAHFGSREDLQIEVLKLYHHHFEQEVFYPSLKEARGLPRLQAMFALWVKRVTVEIASGCIYISGAVEYDDRPGPIREALDFRARYATETRSPEDFKMNGLKDIVFFLESFGQNNREYSERKNGGSITQAVLMMKKITQEI